jgi:hypothetical protein
MAPGASGVRPSGQSEQTDKELGIPHAESMILQLSSEEVNRLKQILNDKPLDEARSYLVTRYFMKKCKSKPRLSDDLFDAADRKNIQQFFDIDYCLDFNEELDAMNALLFLGIDPDKGVTPKVKKHASSSAGSGLGPDQAAKNR